MAWTCLNAASPTATDYTYEECQASLRPYPEPEGLTETPDSLHAIFINHVGRHGARYPSSPKNTLTLQNALRRADSLNTITPAGRKLLALTHEVAERSHNYWGALDSLGAAEQRGIAARMFLSYPELFIGGKVSALSSYSPRCVMSMYEFTHQLDRLNNDVEITTSAGRQNSRLMRPFDTDKDFTAYIRSQIWATPYEDYLDTQVSTAPLKRILGERYPLSPAETRELSLAEYGFLAGLSAMSVDAGLSQYYTREEINAMWSCYNLRQYLQRTANTLSAVPAEVAVPLLLDLIRTTDSAAKGTAPVNVMLRFGHAETLLPLFSLMRLRGAYYLTNYFDTVGQHFRDFELVPMAANIRFILFENSRGKLYLRTDLNEHPIPLMPNDDRIYLPWEEARNYLVRCLPLIDQP